MKLFVTGGTGFIGAALCPALVSRGHELVIVTRSPASQPPLPKVTFLSWESDEWPRIMAEADGVVNMAGEPIAAKRWTARQKDRIRTSRIETTRRLVDTLARLPRRPSTLISASAIGFYGPRGDEELTEADPSGGGFLADTCRAWEAEAQRAERLGVRVVRLRIGLVLGPDGGALAKMVPPFRWFLGGPLGDGRQWISWIHRDDVVGLITWALEHRAIAGAVNATALQPVRMAVFCRMLGLALRRPSWAPAPAPVLRLLLGEMAELLLTGQRALPRAAQEAGYAFRFPEFERALRACLR